MPWTARYKFLQSSVYMLPSDHWCVESVFYSVRRFSCIPDPSAPFWTTGTTAVGSIPCACDAVRKLWKVVLKWGRTVWECERTVNMRILHFRMKCKYCVTGQTLPSERSTTDWKRLCCSGRGDRLCIAGIEPRFFGAWSLITNWSLFRASHEDAIAEGNADTKWNEENADTKWNM
jgi:hypothetical protein